MRSKNLADTEVFAKTVLESISNTSDNGAAVLALSGELGSGKTAFVKILAELLGVEETVTSPTFVIEKIYKIEGHPRFTRLVHVDAYRLDNAHELETLGFKEVLENPKHLVAIEWPERVAGIVPVDATRINFTFINDTEREIELVHG